MSARTESALTTATAAVSRWTAPSGFASVESAGPLAATILPVASTSMMSWTEATRSRCSRRTAASIDAGVCAQGSKDGVLVAWNVRDTGATQVEVTLVTKEGDERTFGKGGPVGAKESGRWVRPGRVFKIRDAADGQELGSLTIDDAGC